MTTYKYKGLSPDGAKLSGVIKAYNEFEAVAQLRETCSVITKIEEVKETQSWNKQIGTKKIKDKELAIICSQFAIILTSGLPIVRCVEMVAAQAAHQRTAKNAEKGRRRTSPAVTALRKALKTTLRAFRPRLLRPYARANSPAHWKNALKNYISITIKPLK